MSALVPPDAAPAPGLPGELENLLIAQLEAQQTCMAQELHDALGSRLAAIVMMLGAMKTAHANQTISQTALEHVIAQAQEAVQVVRRLARGLMPADTEPGALWRLLERLCADYEQIDGLRCEFGMQGDFDDLAAGVSNHLYRIAQEAITNALRNGKARHVVVTLARYTAHCEMVVSDDGVGFGLAAAAPAHQGGLGLRSMRARSAMMGAHLSIQARLSGGTTVKVSWPSCMPSA